jgi:fructoselysine-6-P-deglycase FrlB-like protein
MVAFKVTLIEAERIGAVNDINNEADLWACPFFVALASCQWLAYSQASAQPNQHERNVPLESVKN